MRGWPVGRLRWGGVLPAAMASRPHPSGLPACLGPKNTPTSSSNVYHRLCPRPHVVLSCPSLFIVENIGRPGPFSSVCAPKIAGQPHSTPCRPAVPNRLGVMRSRSAQCSWDHYRCREVKCLGQPSCRHAPVGLGTWCGCRRVVTTRSYVELWWRFPPSLPLPRLPRLRVR